MNALLHTVTADLDPILNWWRDVHQSSRMAFAVRLIGFALYRQKLSKYVLNRSEWTFFLSANSKDGRAKLVSPFFLQDIKLWKAWKYLIKLSFFLSFFLFKVFDCIVSIKKVISRAVMYFFWKYYSFNVSFVGLDAKGIGVAQPIWPWVCLT